MLAPGPTRLGPTAVTLGWAGPIIGGAFPERDSVSVPRLGPPKVGPKARPPSLHVFGCLGLGTPLSPSSLEMRCF